MLDAKITSLDGLPVPRRSFNWFLGLGLVFVVDGILMLAYFLLVFEPVVQENLESGCFIYSIPDDIYYIGQMGHKVVGNIAGGVLSLIGTIFIAIGYFKKKTA